MEEDLPTLASRYSDSDTNPFEKIVEAAIVDKDSAFRMTEPAARIVEKKGLFSLLAL